MGRLPLMLALSALLVASVAAAAAKEAAKEASATDKHIDLLMPGVSPHKEDTYLCTGIRLTGDRYIRAFDPQHASGHAHHIIVTACKEPGSATDKVWNCGEMETKSQGAATAGYKTAPQCAADTRIIYAYAMDAPALSLPEGVTFGVGPSFDLPWLVVQVHYKNAADFVKNPSLKDNSGVKLAYQTAPSPKLAGVHISLTDGVIPAHSVTHMATSCSYDGEATLHPFAFRTHTHALGRVVSGYRVRDGRWSLIGSANPQKPQMFYPVNGTGAVRPGDLLAAKCVMENTGDKDVSIGATQKDEMCNFYMMYWMPAKDIGKDGSHMCFASGELWNFAPKTVADLSSTIPGTDRVFREMDNEMNREMHRMNRLMQQMLGDDSVLPARANEFDMPESADTLSERDLFEEGPRPVFDF